MIMVPLIKCNFSSTGFHLHLFIFHSLQRHQRLQEQDQNTWWETFTKLQRICRKAAQVLFIAKRIDRDQMHNYFMSGGSQYHGREKGRNVVKRNEGIDV